MEQAYENHAYVSFTAVLRVPPDSFFLPVFGRPLSIRATKEERKQNVRKLLPFIEIW